MKNYSEEEMANYFAKCLLMPQDRFINSLERNFDGKKVNISAVAEEFGVDINTATQRGVDLGLISTW